MLLYGVAAASKWRCVGSGDQFTYRSAAFPPYKGHVKNRGSNVLTWLKTFFLSVFGFWEAKSLAGSPQKWLPPINFTEDITLPSTAHVYEYQGLTLLWFEILSAEELANGRKAKYLQAFLGSYQKLRKESVDIIQKWDAREQSQG